MLFEGNCNGIAMAINVIEQTQIQFISNNCKITGSSNHHFNSQLMTALLRNKRIFHFQFSKVFVCIGVIPPSFSRSMNHPCFCSCILLSLHLIPPQLNIHPFNPILNNINLSIIYVFLPKKRHPENFWLFQGKTCFNQPSRDPWSPV